MSYSYAGSIQGLTNFFLANLPSPLTLAKIDIPNNGFTKPSSGHWAKISFTTIASEQVTPDWRRDEAIFAIDLFYPNGGGVIGQMQDAENLRNLLENTYLSDAETHKATINDLGKSGPWYHIQIQLNYTFEGK